MDKERIVVTGYGIKVPGGYNAAHFTDTLLTGNSALALFKGKGTEGKDIAFGVVHDKLEEVMEKKYRRYPRISLLAMAAVKEAALMAGNPKLDPYRTGIFMGTAVGGTLGYDELVVLAQQNNFKDIPVSGCGVVHYHSLASSVAEMLQVNGVTRTVATGCAAGIEAIQDAMMYLRAGELDTCIVGGADAPLSKTVLYAFAKIRCLSQNKELHHMGVPFSKKSAGFVMGEGASVVVLERESTALQRGADILGVIDGVSTSNDAKGIFFSDNKGEHMLHTLKCVTEGKAPTYVNSQALGMAENDNIEATNHMKLFGSSIPITSIKSITGHTFGASAGAQLVSSLISMQHGFIPGTVHATLDDYPELPIVYHTIQTEVESAVITSHGYGGNNASLFVSKY
ncbi:beta-ketoacyl synthase N-terminal-like domain-containing protein [Aneurinibacillus sp. REN35]|uniref:beta-ketoacyl synthase N-terminal-like domain-containing protein n=1 Tax=Aneurinibacillus sp. REN35 TaxID=3237286 RepID=UPI0035273F9B